MKNIFISAALAICVFGDTQMYSEDVKDVYLNSNDTKSVGKLLPTNAVRILETKDDKVKIALKGYQNPDALNVIYFSPTQRIIAVAFAKTAKPEIKIVKSGENGVWNEVETIVYTKKENFTNDLKGLFDKAQTLYKDSCGVCHALHQTTHYKANQWPSLLKSMIGRTAIGKDNEWLVSQFLQKHSADVNVDKK